MHAEIPTHEMELHLKRIRNIAKPSQEMMVTIAGVEQDTLAITGSCEGVTATMFLHALIKDPAPVTAYVDDLLRAIRPVACSATLTNRGIQHTWEMQQYRSGDERHASPAQDARSTFWAIFEAEQLSQDLEWVARATYTGTNIFANPDIEDCIRLEPMGQQVFRFTASDGLRMHIQEVECLQAAPTEAEQQPTYLPAETSARAIREIAKYRQAIRVATDDDTGDIVLETKMSRVRLASWQGRQYPNMAKLVEEHPDVIRFSNQAWQRLLDYAGAAAPADRIHIIQRDNGDTFTAWAQSRERHLHKIYLETEQASRPENRIQFTIQARHLADLKRVGIPPRISAKSSQSSLQFAFQHPTKSTAVVMPMQTDWTSAETYPPDLLSDAGPSQY